MEQKLSQPKYPNDNCYMLGYRHGMKNSEYITPFTDEDLRNIAYGLDSLIENNEKISSSTCDGYFTKEIESRNAYLKKLKERVLVLFGTGKNNEETGLKSEKQPDMREKVGEYIREINAEIKRLEKTLVKASIHNQDITKIENRLEVLAEVKNDLLGRLDEVV